MTEAGQPPTCLNGLVLGTHQQQLSTGHIQQAPVLNTNPAAAVELLPLLLCILGVRTSTGHVGTTPLVVRVLQSAVQTWQGDKCLDRLDHWFIFIFRRAKRFSLASPVVKTAVSLTVMPWWCYW